MLHLPGNDPCLLAGDGVNPHIYRDYDDHERDCVVHCDMLNRLFDTARYPQRQRHDPNGTEQERGALDICSELVLHWRYDGYVAIDRHGGQVADRCRNGDIGKRLPCNAVRCIRRQSVQEHCVHGLRNDTNEEICRRQTRYEHVRDGVEMPVARYHNDE